MELVLNGLTFGGNSKYQITPPITGLDTPPIRMGQGDWSGRDGGYVSSQFYSSRVIVIEGFYFSRNCNEADDLRKNLIASIPLRQSLPLYITNFAGRKFLSQTYIKDFKADITEPGFGKFQITLVAPDHLLYDAGDGIDPDSGFVNLPVYKLIGGGYVTQYNMPAQWTPGTQPTVAQNLGEVMIYPQFKIVGPTTNPTIFNLTENKFVKINVTTTNPTDELIIDMYARTVTLNGGSILSFRTLDSTWWGLRTGDNVIQFNTDGGGDTNYGTLRWRNAYQGI
jgi:hypothetical protein